MKNKGKQSWRVVRSIAAVWLNEINAPRVVSSGVQKSKLVSRVSNSAPFFPFSPFFNFPIRFSLNPLTHVELRPTLFDVFSNPCNLFRTRKPFDYIKRISFDHEAAEQTNRLGERVSSRGRLCAVGSRYCAIAARRAAGE